jgi:hypothetical protein
MIFKGNVIEAKYINPAYDTIEILWSSDGVIHPYTIDISDEESMEVLLGDGWDLERILDSTAEYKRNSSVSIDNIVDARVKEIVAIEMNSSREAFVNNFHDEVLNNNSNVDTLFKFKLSLFEMPVVKEGDKKFKKRLRTAKSIIECYAILNEVYVEKT